MCAFLYQSGRLFAIALAAFFFSHAWAQDRYPARPITLIAGFAAGTGGDVATRSLAEKLSLALGQPVIVDNQPGAGGVVGAGKGAHAAPDGYTLSVIPNWIMNIRPHLVQNLPYDPFKDFSAVAHVASFPTVLYATPNLKVNTVQEFVELVKKAPGKYTYASPGVGTAQHLAMEQLMAITGMNLLHVPFSGSAMAASESVAGRVDAGFNGISTLAPFIKEGKLVPLAWAEDRRNSVLPDLPTMAQAGIKGFNNEVSIQLWGPKGLRPEIVQLLNKEINKAVSDPALKTRWAAIGLEPKAATPEEVESAMKAGWETNQALIKKLNIKVD